jgi:hypothetical protein
MTDHSGEIPRWVVLIDGEAVPEADIRVRERKGRSVMLLTNGSDEIELTWWREDGRGPAGPPGSVIDTLGALKRRSSKDGEG